MRLVTQLETVNHALNMLLILSTAGLGVWLWQHGHIQVGAAAAAIGMALRLNGLSHWIMWETAQLFEQIGTVQDGMNTLSKPHTVLDAPNAKELNVSRGLIEFKDVTFHYDTEKPLLEHLTLSIALVKNWFGWPFWRG